MCVKIVDLKKKDLNKMKTPFLLGLSLDSWGQRPQLKNGLIPLAKEEGPLNSSVLMPRAQKRFQKTEERTSD